LRIVIGQSFARLATSLQCVAVAAPAAIAAHAKQLGFISTLVLFAYPSVTFNGIRSLKPMAGTIFDTMTLPPAAKLLGWQVVKLDIDAREIELGFDGKPEFANPAGLVQGASFRRCWITRWAR
jgi:hypothetical protein